MLEQQMLSIINAGVGKGLTGPYKVWTSYEPDLHPLPNPALMTESICCSSMSEGCPEVVTLLRVFLLI